MKQHNLPFITRISVHFKDLDVIMPDKEKLGDFGMFLWITHYIPGDKNLEYTDHIQLRLGNYPLTYE